jgi:hypothetical protein
MEPTHLNCIIEGPEPTQDISYKLIEKHQILQEIEKGIPTATYLQQYPKRALDKEFQLLQKLTETNAHRSNLFTDINAPYKVNRYKEILPCILINSHTHCRQDTSTQKN